MHVKIELALALHLHLHLAFAAFEMSVVRSDLGIEEC